jgi:integrase
MNILPFPISATSPSRPALAGEPMRYHAFPDLIRAYLDEHLKGKPSYANQLNVAKRWLLTLLIMPTRQQIRERHRLTGHGHFEKGSSQANAELKLLRAAIRWGLDNECWDGHDPTLGVKKWKTARRDEVLKREDLKSLLRYFEEATTELAIRNRALFGLMLFTGCRPGEARKALLTSIQPYGAMGLWQKGVTKNHKKYQVPVPTQYLPWLAAGDSTLSQTQFLLIPRPRLSGALDGGCDWTPLARPAAHPGAAGPLELRSAAVPRDPHEQRAECDGCEN